MITSMLTRRRHRAVWRDPVRKLRTLQGFAETEEDGGKDLAAAAVRVSDADLRGHLERHSADELRHAELFRKRARELESQTAHLAHSGEQSDKPYDLSSRRPGVELDSHGFYNSGLFDELGEVAYVAMLHVAEQRAAQLLALHRDLNDSDAETRAVFDQVLRDEHYHVAYTERFLERWRADGREQEVRSALRAARRSRFAGAWKRLGTRSAAGFSKVVLYLLYWTALAPLALLARFSRDKSQWQAPPAATGDEGQSQY